MAKTTKKQVTNIIKNNSFLNSTHKKELKKLVKAWDEPLLNLYEFMSFHFHTSVYYGEKESVYLENHNKILMDMDNAISFQDIKQGLSGAFTTKFHEEFHQLEFLLSSPVVTGGVGIGFTSQLSPYGKRLYNALELDTLKFINASIISFSEEKTLTSLKRIPQYAKDSTMEALHALNTRYENFHLCVLTDGIGMITKGRLNPFTEEFFGHTTSYCKQNGELWAASELWANLGSALLMQNEDTLKAIQKFTPRCYEEFIKILDEIEPKIKEGI